MFTSHSIYSVKKCLTCVIFGGIIKMALLPLLILLSISTLTTAQRPFFAGSKPIGYPAVETSTADGLGDRFGEVNGTTTTQRLPIEALGDKNLVDRLSKLPKDQQPFWFLNWQALEEQRKNPQTYPLRPSQFAQPLNTGGGSSSSNENIANSNANIANSNTNVANSNTNPANSNTNFASSNTNLANGNTNVANRNTNANSNSNVASSFSLSSANKNPANNLGNRFGDSVSKISTEKYPSRGSSDIPLNTDSLLANRYSENNYNTASEAKKPSKASSDVNSKVKITNSVPPEMYDTDFFESYDTDN